MSREQMQKVCVYLDPFLLPLAFIWLKLVCCFLGLPHSHRGFLKLNFSPCDVESFINCCHSREMLGSGKRSLNLNIKPTHHLICLIVESFLSYIDDIHVQIMHCSGHLSFFHSQWSGRIIHFLTFCIFIFCSAHPKRL